LEGLATESHATNQLDEAIAARERIAQLLAGAGDAHEGRNLSQLAMVLAQGFRNADGRAASGRAIELLEGLAPSVELATAYRVEAQIRVMSRDCRDAVRVGCKAIELARRFGARAELAASYATVGSALLFLDYDAGCEYVHRGLEISLADDLDPLTARCY